MLFDFSICSTLLTLFVEKIWGDNPYNNTRKMKIEIDF